MSKLIEKIKSMPVTVKASVAYTICSVLQKGLVIITMPLFTRLLSQEQYGQYTVYSSWSSLLMIFLTLNLAFGSFSTAMVRFEKERDEYIASLQGIACTLVAAFMALYLPLQSFWNELLGLPTPFVILMVLEILANFAISCWMGKNRFEFKYVSVVLLTMVNSLVAPLVAALLVVVSEDKGYARIAGYAGVAIALGSVLFAINLSKGKRLYNKKYWRYALAFNIPLIPYYLSQVIFNMSDRIMIDHFCGTADAGIYNVGYQLAVVLTFVLNSINDAYVPWMYGKMRTGDQKENQSVANGIAFLMGTLLLGVTAMAPEIIRVMAGWEYYPAMHVVPPVAMSILLLFYSQLFINVQFYYEEKMLLVYASVGSAVINLILNAIFIPKFGFVAAAYTTLASYVVFALANYITMRYSLYIHGVPNDCFDMRGLMAILGVYTALAILALVLYPYRLVRCILTAVALLAIIIKSKSIINFLKVFKNR